jgi:predicted ATP-dependent endonuclease of OLD family
MVKIGFICEGQTEQILLQCDTFRQLLLSLNVESLPVINAGGSGNLLPHNIEGYIARLERERAKAIIILTDLDEDLCISKTTKRIGARPKDIVIIAVKKIEAWFLACSPAMEKMLGVAKFDFANPEEDKTRFETINQLLTKHTGRGVGKKAAGKIKLVNRLLDNGLDLSTAAAHKNCPSAAYFIKKLTEAGKGTH